MRNSLSIELNSRMTSSNIFGRLGIDAGPLRNSLSTLMPIGLVVECDAYGNAILVISTEGNLVLSWGKKNKKKKKKRKEKEKK